MKNGRWESYVYEELEAEGKRTVTLATKGGALRLAFAEENGAVRFQVEQIESRGQGVSCPVAEGIVGELTEGGPEGDTA